MAKDTTLTTQAKPIARLYVVNGEGDNAHWLPVGAAWRHSDGKGYNLTLDALPKNGRIVMRRIKENGGQQ